MEALKPKNLFLVCFFTLWALGMASCGGRAAVQTPPPAVAKPSPSPSATAVVSQVTPSPTPSNPQGIQPAAWKIGVLAPLTGKFKAFGQSVVNGITLAVEQANASGSSKKAEFTTKDTAGNPVQAVKIFESLSRDNELDAVIGPVASSEIAGVAPLANQARIALICPASTREGLSTLGPYIFTNSITNEMQGRAIARYAVERLNLKKFGILAPEDGYGETLAGSFKKEAESRGATVTAYETYTPNSTDFKKQLMALGGQDPESSKENDRENSRRLDELKYALKKQVTKILLKAKDTAGSAGDNADAMAFIPLVESLSNTTSPSIVKDVSEALRQELEGKEDFALRGADLVQQAMTRLPAEAKGSTLPASAEKWADVAEDLQAAWLVTGRVTETAPPAAEEAADASWYYQVELEAFRMNPAKKNFTRFYHGKVPYKVAKAEGTGRPRADYQALYLPAHSAEIPLLVSQIHFYDLNTLFLGGHLWENKAILAESAKDLEGAYFVTGFFRDSDQGATKKFVKDYVARFNQVPDLLAAQAYDAASLMLKAVSNSSSREDVHNKLLEIRDFDGVCGKTSFGGHGEADKMVPILKIENGKYKQVQ